MISRTAEQYMGDQQQPDIESAKQPLSQGKLQPETIFAALRRSRLPDEEKTISRMAQEGTEIFMASFTPGRTMMTAMYYLHVHPSVLETLRKELDEANPDRSNILRFRTLNSLPYMRSVTKEILRVSFPVGSRLPLICHDDMAYGDWTIPKGVSRTTQSPLGKLTLARHRYQ